MFTIQFGGFPPIFGIPPMYFHHPLPPTSTPLPRHLSDLTVWLFLAGFPTGCTEKICSNLSSFFPYPKIPHPFLRILLHIDLFWKKNELPNFRISETWKKQTWSSSHVPRGTGFGHPAPTARPPQWDLRNWTQSFFVSRKGLWFWNMVLKTNIKR